MSKRVRNRVQTPHFEWRTRTHLPFGVLSHFWSFLKKGSNTVHDCYSLQSCMVGFRMGYTFFIAFFSDFGWNGFVEN